MASAGKALAIALALTPFLAAIYLMFRGTGSTRESYAVLAELEKTVGSSAELYMKALTEIKCSLCRDALSRIKNLPIEEQTEGIKELRRVVEAAKISPKLLEYELENAKILNKVMLGG